MDGIGAFSLNYLEDIIKKWPLFLINSPQSKLIHFIDPFPMEFSKLKVNPPHRSFISQPNLHCIVVEQLLNLFHFERVLPWISLFGIDKETKN